MNSWAQQNKEFILDITDRSILPEWDGWTLLYCLPISALPFGQLHCPTSPLQVGPGSRIPLWSYWDCCRKWLSHPSCCCIRAGRELPAGGSAELLVLCPGNFLSLSGNPSYGLQLGPPQWSTQWCPNQMGTHKRGTWCWASSELPWCCRRWCSGRCQLKASNACTSSISWPNRCCLWRGGRSGTSKSIHLKSSFRISLPTTSGGRLNA